GRIVGGDTEAEVAMHLIGAQMHDEAAFFGLLVGADGEGPALRREPLVRQFQRRLFRDDALDDAADAVLAVAADAFGDAFQLDFRLPGPINVGERQRQTGEGGGRRDGPEQKENEDGQHGGDRAGAGELQPAGIDDSLEVQPYRAADGPLDGLAPEAGG